MTRQIDQERCIRCGECLVECPNEGISEVDGDYSIDSQLCTHCYGFYEESRCATVCPVDAVKDCPGPSDEDMVARAAMLHPERFPRD